MGPYLRRPQRRAIALALAVALGLAGVAHAGDQSGRRFPLRDRGPFSAIIGIGDAWPDPSGPALELSWDIASHAMAEQSGAETLILDGETHALTLRVQQRLGDRLSVAAELPWLTHGGGFLDDVIDSWHDAFGLSEGIRPSLPNGDLDFVYAVEGLERFRLDDSTSGMGDLRTSAAWRLAGDGSGALRLDLVGEIEWGTGDARRLTGSGGTDVAAGLRLAAPAGEAARLDWTLVAGIAWPGEIDLPLPPPSGQIWYYDASVAWAAWPSLDLVLQAAGHSGSYQSGLDVLGGSALQLGGGVVWRFTRRYGLRFGVFEDIRTDTTPDFASELTLFYMPQ
jgi:hypothetical protein